MTVTLLDERSRLAIELAVAQWLGSERCASAARQHLRGLGVDESDIERYRRADAPDDALRSLLRFSVTTMIARGRFLASDVRRLRPRPSDAILAEAVFITARAFLRVALVESLDVWVPDAPPLAMTIGDY